jgi:hypothetical protein
LDGRPRPSSATRRRSGQRGSQTRRNVIQSRPRRAPTAAAATSRPDR